MNKNISNCSFLCLNVRLTSGADGKGATQAETVAQAHGGQIRSWSGLSDFRQDSKAQLSTCSPTFHGLSHGCRAKGLFGINLHLRQKSTDIKKYYTIAPNNP
jgi:hypothetical protein